MKLYIKIKYIKQYLLLIYNTYMNKNYYKVLGVSVEANDSEIKKAYFSKAKMYHPDVCKDKDAEEKFKEVSAAYETLKDVDSRKKYDDYIKSNPNSQKSEYNNSSQNYSKEYSILHSMFSSSSNNDSYFFNAINDNFKTETEIANAYSYFWLSFWSGGKGTIEMLKNKNASRIFKSFCENYFIKKMKESLIKEVESNSLQKEKVKQMKVSLDKIYASIPKQNATSQEVYNWMIKLINDDNIFDDENSMYYFLLMPNEVLKVLQKFEGIFDANSSIRAKSHYSNNVKIRRGGGLFSGILTVILIIIIFRVFF